MRWGDMGSALPRRLKPTIPWTGAYVRAEARTLRLLKPVPIGR